MTSAEWGQTVKRRLLAGWVLRSSESLDDAGYFSWLRPFTLDAINEALDGLAGTDWMPKANEIVRRIQTPSAGRREAEWAEQARAFEARHRKAGTWIEPSVDAAGPVVRTAA